MPSSSRSLRLRLRLIALSAWQGGGADPGEHLLSSQQGKGSGKGWGLFSVSIGD